MKNIATKCMPEVVSDLGYDFKKMLESCPQVASYPLRQPIFLGILVRVPFTDMCIVSDQISETGNEHRCSELHARSSLSCISPTHKRTEGRAPVWGSEFTSKDAALQGDRRNCC
jgi:hypothetical protein